MNTANESITQIAFNNIRNNDYLVERCSTPEKVLEYLEKDDYFKTLSEQLKETMRESKLCNKESPIDEYIDILYERISKQDVECERKRGKKDIAVRSRATIERWFKGTTKSTDSRMDAIEICFALGLSYELATEFLNKLGYCGFNVRNIQDAIYVYCLINKYPLKAARQLEEKYNAHESTENTTTSLKQAEHNGMTTMHIQSEILSNSNWENDEQFLKTFLLKNKQNFTGYSFNAEKEYYCLKNNAFLLMIATALANEELLKNARDAANMKTDSTDQYITPKFLKNLELYKGPLSYIQDAKKALKKDNSNLNEIIAKLYLAITSVTEINELKDISKFLNTVIGNKTFLKYTISGIVDSSEELRRKTESLLKDTVLKEFPDGAAFSKFEKNTADASLKITTRKAIILLYFIAYSFETTTNIANDLFQSTNSSEQFKEFGLIPFMGELNGILRKCQLQILYPANQFDWLILRCVAELETIGYDLLESLSPLEFFIDVLHFSFNDELSKY